MEGSSSRPHAACRWCCKGEGTSLSKGPTHPESRQFSIMITVAILRYQRNADTSLSKIAFGYAKPGQVHRTALLGRKATHPCMHPITIATSRQLTLMGMPMYILPSVSLRSCQPKICIPDEPHELHATIGRDLEDNLRPASRRFSLVPAVVWCTWAEYAESKARCVLFSSRWLVTNVSTYVGMIILSRVTMFLWH
nr:hypothetical protein CFP56_41497 [Quercus suber]